MPSATLDSTTNSLHLSILEDLRDPFFGIEFENQAALIEKILGDLENLRGKIVIAVDGIPGAGKSSFSHPLLEALRTRGYNPVSTPVDLFIKQKETEAERAANLFRSDADFLRLYCDYEKVRALVEKVLSADSEWIEAQGVYNRETRGYHTVQIPIPKYGDTRIVILEGVNALGVAKKIKEEKNCDCVIPIAIGTDPRLALFRKMNRNLALGRVNTDDPEGMATKFAAEAKDIAYAIRLILNSTLERWKDQKDKIYVLKQAD